MNFLHSTELAIFGSAFKDISAEFLSNIDRFIRLILPGGNDNNYFFITVDFRSFVYGNVCSMFGLKNNQHEPQEIPLLRRRFISQVDYGHDFVAILTYDGSVFVAKDDRDWKSNGPLHLVSGPNSFSHISCCSRHLMLIQRGGRIAQLGNLQNGIASQDKIVLGNLRNVIKISTGAQHAMALTNIGELHTMGRNQNGQMGFGNLNLVADMDLIRVPLNELRKTGQQISNVVCGESHTLILLGDGSIFGCGSNKYGELGLGQETNVPILTRIPLFDQLVAVAARSSLTVSMAFNKEGNCWIWGRIRAGHTAKTKPVNIGRIEPASFPDAITKDHQFPMTFELTWIRDSTLDYKEYLFNYFSEKLLDNRANSNVTFMVENRPIYARREYLCLVSEYFDRMFTNQWKSMEIVNLYQQYKYDEFMTFLKILHFGSITLNDDNIERLTQLAVNHQDERILQHCRRFIIRRLNSNNHQTMATLAQKFNLEGIKEMIKYRIDQQNQNNK